MIYSNPEFLLFFMAASALYALAPAREVRFWVLLGASLVFYAWTGLTDTAIFLSVVFASWLAVALARRFPAGRKAWIAAGIVVMALHLFFWKYASWATGQVQRLYPGFLGGLRPDLHLPIGISFFTLQGIAYLADFAADEAKYMNLPTYLLFKSFFAQLVAGPIVRARQLLPQLERLERPTSEDVWRGLCLFALGFFKKLVVADRVAVFVDAVFAAPADFDRVALIKALLGYTAQIWADFSGYTDMGRGAARMLGIRLPENFLSPYLARSPSEFWRRWHVTLSEWIRDYLYIPLGGGKGSPARVFAVLIFTFAVSGLWHGASWHFLLWGLYHGALLVGDRGLRLSEGAERSSPPFQVLRGCVMFALTVFGWLLFRAPSVAAIGVYLKALAAGTGRAATTHLHARPVLAFVALALAMQAVAYQDLKTGRRPVLEFLGSLRLPRGRAVAFAAGLLLAAVFTVSVLLRPPAGGGNFIYFQF
ncbi:MAG: MBOAT family protein [Elusimicrobia bacterium]|nr:MBOAT family protein [Elusimicrobiota bacterium]